MLGVKASRELFLLPSLCSTHHSAFSVHSVIVAFYPNIWKEANSSAPYSKYESVELYQLLLAHATALRKFLWKSPDKKDIRLLTAYLADAKHCAKCEKTEIQCDKHMPETAQLPRP